MDEESKKQELIQSPADTELVETENCEIERCDAEPLLPEKKKNEEKKNVPFWGFSIPIAAVLLAFCVWFIDGAIKEGMSSAKALYSDEIKNAYTETQTAINDKGYAKGEEDYRVSNYAAISVDGIREEALLEVLEVTDVIYEISTQEENEEGITAWYEVPGKGVFTVDLKASEFLVDEERSYVLVRVPKPELTRCSIVYSDVKELLFKNNAFNDSIRIGEQTAKEALEHADLLLKRSLGSNTMFYESAKHSAEVMIINLVKTLNPKRKELMVEVEFIK